MIQRSGNQRLIRVLAVLIASLLSSSCGFQLRGLHALDQKPAWPEIKLDCPEQEKFFCNRLRDQLIQAGSRVIDVSSRTDAFPADGGSALAAGERQTEEVLADPNGQPPTAIPTLRIASLVGGRRAVTLTANAGAAEFEVSRSVLFEMSEGPTMLLTPTTLRQFQTYRYDSSSVLGKDKEETQIRNDLDNLLAYQIANRVAIEGIKRTGRADAR